jgi:hypothetical protein
MIIKPFNRNSVEPLLRTQQAIGRYGNIYLGKLFTMLDPENTMFGVYFWVEINGLFNLFGKNR